MLFRYWHPWHCFKIFKTLDSLRLDSFQYTSSIVKEWYCVWPSSFLLLPASEWAWCHYDVINLLILLTIAEEDTYGSYSRLLLKYFLSEGVMCGHSLFVASVSERGEDILKVSKSGYVGLYEGQSLDNLLWRSRYTELTKWIKDCHRNF